MLALQKLPQGLPHGYSYIGRKKHEIYSMMVKEL